MSRAASISGKIAKFQSRQRGKIQFSHLKAHAGVGELGLEHVISVARKQFSFPSCTLLCIAHYAKRVLASLFRRGKDLMLLHRRVGERFGAASTSTKGRSSRGTYFENSKRRHVTGVGLID